MTTTSNLPRVSAGVDLFDTFKDFHEAVRDIVAWAPSIVDAKGEASPRDARWLRAFLRGPLLWHQSDEDEVLAPVLAGKRHVWLDACVDRAQDKRQRLGEVADDVVALLDPLAAGERVQPQRFAAAIRSLERAVESSLRYEDDIILPSGRLFLEAPDRAALVRTIASRDELRSWAAVAGAGDAGVPHRVHALRIIGAPPLDAVRLFTECPRGRAVSLSDCESCPHLESVRVDQHGVGEVSCAIDNARAQQQRHTVSEVMTRDVVCVTRGASLLEAMQALAHATVSGLPVVDVSGRAVGILSQSDIVAAIAAGIEPSKRVVSDVMMHAAFVVHETDAIEHAGRLLIMEGIHRLPVVNAVGLVVGIVSALDILRASLPSAPTTSPFRVAGASR